MLNFIFDNIPAYLLTIPGLLAIFAFYFLYKGIKFVLKIIFYIIATCVVLFVMAKYLGLI